MTAAGHQEIVKLIGSIMDVVVPEDGSQFFFLFYIHNTILSNQGVYIYPASSIFSGVKKVKG
jgi:hypothetical protein